MMVSLLIFLSKFSLGVDYSYGYLSIDDFSQHIEHINNRTKELGYKGELPQLPQFKGNPGVAIFFLRDHPVGFYLNGEFYQVGSYGEFRKESISITQDYRFRMLSLSSGLLARLGRFYISSGIILPYVNLSVMAEGIVDTFSYFSSISDLLILCKMGTSIPLSSKMSIYLEGFVRYGVVDGFENLWFEEREGFLYSSEGLITETSRPARIDMTGGGLRIGLEYRFLPIK